MQAGQLNAGAVIVRLISGMIKHILRNTTAVNRVSTSNCTNKCLALVVFMEFHTNIYPRRSIQKCARRISVIDTRGRFVFCRLSLAVNG